MDSVLEVLGIFLRLFIALGSAVAAGVAVTAATATVGIPDPAEYGLIALGYVLGRSDGWVWGE